MRAQRWLCGRSLPGCSTPAALPATTGRCLPWSSCSRQQPSNNCNIWMVSLCHSLLAPRGHCLTRRASFSGSGRTWLCASWRECSHEAPAPMIGSVSAAQRSAAQIHAGVPGLPGTSSADWPLHGSSRDWWTARLTHRLVVLATADQVAAIPPAEAARLLAEADAAYRRCHTVLPWLWVAQLKRGQMSGRAMRPAIEAHTQRGAAGWDSALRQLGSQGYSEGRAAVLAHVKATARCAGCWESSLALRRCAACQGTLYCRWVAGLGGGL